MKQQHAPEPWREVVNCGDDYETHPILIYSGAEYVGQVATDQHEHANTDANARRIVACVNACRGLDTETLEAAPPWKAHRVDEQTRFQRDELAAALREVHRLIVDRMSDDDADADEMRDICNAALAKVQS